MGANIGIHTLTASPIAKEVIAFEPSPANMQRLQANLALNNLQNVRTEPCVLSDKSGNVILNVLDGANKTASVCDVPGKFHEVRCEAITLDSYLQGKQVDFIKIDTDGHDREVLVGAKNTITRHRPVIIFEDSDATVSPISRRECDTLLSSLGYSQIVIGPLNTLCLPNA